MFSPAQRTSPTERAFANARMKRPQHNNAPRDSDAWSRLPQATRNRIGYAAIIVIAALVVFAPLFNSDFVNWDDTGLVQENPLIRDLSWSNIKAMFALSSIQEFKHYLPLVLLSYAVEYQLAGLNPAVFHATNVFLHIANSLLLLWLIARLTKSEGVASVTALLFAIHPMHVESVAWITERKDMLSTLFFLASLSFYALYLDRNWNRRYLLAALAAMVLSLMAKAMAVSIPVVLVLMDALRDRKITKRSLREKIPFAIVSVVAGMTAFLSQYMVTDGGIESGSAEFGVMTVVRGFFVACYNILLYVAKLIWPSDLSVLYTGAAGWPLPAQYLVAPAVLGLIVVGVIALRKRFELKFATFGLLFFVVTVLPVAQLIPVGVAQQADRFVYIPAIGMFLLGGLGAEALYRRLAGRSERLGLALVVVLVVVMGSYAYGARARVTAWRDSISLWSAEINRGSPHPMAFVQRGQALAQLNRHEEAIKDYTSAITMDSTLVLAFNNRGNAYARMADYGKAFLDYNKAIALDSTYTDAYLNRGYTYSIVGNVERALRDITRAAELDPLSYQPYAYRGRVLASLGDTQGAIKDFSRALALNPSSAALYAERGDVLFKAAQFTGAIADYSMALSLGLVNEAVLTNRGGALANVGRYDAAIQDFTAALQINPRYVNALRNRGLTYFAKKDYQQAWVHVQQLRRLGVAVDPSVVETLKRELGPAVQ